MSGFVHRTMNASGRSASVLFGAAGPGALLRNGELRRRGRLPYGEASCSKVELELMMNSAKAGAIFSGIQAHARPPGHSSSILPLISTLSIARNILTWGCWQASNSLTGPK